MNFPKPKTITGAYSPIILMTWILGIGIVEYPNGRPRRMISAFFSIINFSVNLVFVRMANFSEVTELQGSKIAAFNYSLNIYFCVIFTGISICLGPARTKILKSYYCKLRIINKRLEILGVPNDYDLVFKTLVFQLLVTFAVMSVTMALDFAFVGTEFPTETSRLGFLLSGHYLLVLAVITDCSLSSVVRYFGNRFQRLNTLLKDSDPLDRSGTVIAPQLDTQLSRHLFVMKEIHGNRLSLLRVAERKLLLHVIRETRAAIEFNGVFGVPVLLSIILSFSLTTSLAYTSYILYMSSENVVKFAVMVGEVIAPIWIVFHIMKILQVIEACETTTYEAKRTGRCISQLLNSPASDDDIRNEINVFSLQLIQNPLNFTAWGFVRLNYSTFGAIIASVTTYLIIMIQMQSVYEPETLYSTPNVTTLSPQTDDMDHGRIGKLANSL